MSLKTFPILIASYSCHGKQSMNILAADITVIPGLEWEHLQVNKTVWPAGLILLFAEGGDSAVFQVVLHQESRLIPVLEIINFRVLVFSTNIYYAVSLCLAACSVLEILICSVTSGGSNSLWPGELEPTRLLCLWDFPRQEYWSGSLCPPPGDLPNPGIEPASPVSPCICRWILYLLSNQGIPEKY